jgi:uncharacterized protein with HEPN domain
MRRDELRLRDVLERIDAAMDAVRGKSPADFHADVQMQKAILNDIMVIGEAANATSKELQEKYPRIPWQNIIGMRNVVVHEYFSVDADIVWETVTLDLASLRPLIVEILSAEFPADSGKT